MQELKEVIKYEQRHGGIILDPSAVSLAHSAGVPVGSNSNSSSGFRAPYASSPYPVSPSQDCADGQFSFVLSWYCEAYCIVFVSAQATAGEGGFYFFLQSPHTISPEYLRISAKKAHLVIRMLEFRIGAQLLLQVLNKQLSLASIHIEQLQQTGMALQPVAQEIGRASCRERV